jgi:hypothetical protein
MRLGLSYVVFFIFIEILLGEPGIIIGNFDDARLDRNVDVPQLVGDVPVAGADAIAGVPPAGVGANLDRIQHRFGFWGEVGYWFLKILLLFLF